MADRRSSIIAALEKNRDACVHQYQSLAPSQLSTRVYHDGEKWTVQQVLAHLITIEKSMHWVFKDILSGGPGSPEDFDIERFNSSQPRKLEGQSIEALIDRFIATRDKTIAIVYEMTEEDLDRKGRHAFHGPGRLERFVSWAYEHAQMHVKDISRALS